MFSWDPAKAEQNLRKHGISFEEAVEAFTDPDLFDGPDIGHSADEERRLLIGKLTSGRVITVAYTRRIVHEGETTRLISARPANSKERAARKQR